jgi:DtxR family transcriptional regulator, Mn-dependent transcriptional regulator
MPDPLISLFVAFLITGILLWLFWPDRGVFWRWQRTGELTERVRREDALKHIHQCEIHGEKPSVKSLAGALNITPNEVAQVLTNLETYKLLVADGADFKLTPAGRDYALRIIRAHRLYERYLADESGFEEQEWHVQAERYEHQLTPEETEALAARLGNPTHDPHGDPIPTASGYMVYPDGRAPLTTLGTDKPARIVHLEDEPETVYAQLVAEGLHVGQEVRLIESSPQRVRFWAAGDEHLLAPVVAANIGVVPLPEELREDEIPGEPLSSLKLGQIGRVVKISPRIRGAERRRLMDLGILPDTMIEMEMSSAGGDPIAYRIRGALLALRKSQADLIHVCLESDECLE